MSKSCSHLAAATRASCRLYLFVYETIICKIAVVFYVLGIVIDYEDNLPRTVS